MSRNIILVLSIKVWFATAYSYPCDVKLFHFKAAREGSFGQTVEILDLRAGQSHSSPQKIRMYFESVFDTDILGVHGTSLEAIEKALASGHLKPSLVNRLPMLYFEPLCILKPSHRKYYDALKEEQVATAMETLSYAYNNGQLHSVVKNLNLPSDCSEVNNLLFDLVLENFESYRYNEVLDTSGDSHWWLRFNALTTAIDHRDASTVTNPDLKETAELLLQYEITSQQLREATLKAHRRLGIILLFHRNAAKNRKISIGKGSTSDTEGHQLQIQPEGLPLQDVKAIIPLGEEEIAYFAQ